MYRLSNSGKVSDIKKFSIKISVNLLLFRLEDAKIFIDIRTFNYYFNRMKAMILEKPGTPLKLAELPVPVPGGDEVLIKVHACGVCRTDLHIIDGELPPPRFPLVLGHQVVGEIVQCGENVQNFKPGDRAGVPWLGSTCRTCSFCRRGEENLCDQAQFTGYHINGGFAEYTTANAQFCFPIPVDYPDLQAAPLLCAGLIGYRAYRMAGDAVIIGMYGFGSAAHILIQTARSQGKRIFAFTRPGDETGQAFARELGAEWAGDSLTLPPEPPDAAILFAPDGTLVPRALQAVRKGGKVICAGIHMSDIPAFPYKYLWEERSIKSVANLTAADGREFLALAPGVPVVTTVQRYPLESANEALNDLRAGRVKGSAVLQ